MIGLFQRREVYITYEEEKYCRACEIFEVNKIKYDRRVRIPHFTVSARLVGSKRGKIPRYGTEYRIYVHKADYERAVYLLREVNRSQA